MLEVNKQEYATNSSELININVQKMVDKNAKSSLNQSRSINDMQLLATASLNAKTTTASDLTSNMTHNLKRQLKHKLILKREILSSQSAAVGSKKLPKP